MQQVKIGGITYDIHYVEEIPNRDTYVGYCDSERSVIYVQTKGMSEQRQKQTLIHEMMHAILYESGYNDHEEELANRIGLVLYQVLKDNDFGFINHQEIDIKKFKNQRAFFIEEE